MGEVIKNIFQIAQTSNFTDKYAPGADLEHIISSLSIQAVAVASVFLVGLVVIASIIRRKYPSLKGMVFTAIATVVLIPTFFLISSTVYLNVVSSSGGPVHWHADFEVWDCGEELDIKDPRGFSNKVGTATLHEHNDKRIHLEGVVIETDDASLGKFFRVIGGSISNRAMLIPLSEKSISRFDGQTCPNGTVGDAQVFVYEPAENYSGAGPTPFYQRKLENPENYIIKPEPLVPPGACIVIEFGQTRDQTDKLCEQYEVAVDLGDYEYGGVVDE